MAKYKYDAKAPNGTATRGEVDASSEGEARVKIRAQRLIPVRVVLAERVIVKRQGPGVKAKDLQVFTRQLSTLLGSGVPIVQALDVLARGARSPGLTFALNNIVIEISKGKKLGDCLADHPKVFDRFYVNMVRAGEESGSLDGILNRLAIYIEKAVKINGKIKGAMVYPIGIVVVSAAVVTLLLVFVIPKFEALFKNGGQELPALTQMVVNASHFLQTFWYLILGGVVGGIFGAKNYYASDEGRKTCDSVFIDIPVFGTLIQKGGVARFTRTLSTLLASGVGIIEALDIASKTTGNWVLEKALLRAKDAISEGKSLTVPFSKEKYVPSMVTEMCGVGETTGALDQMLGKIADFYEDEVDVAVGALTAMMEPMIMVVLGAIIAVIVLAMYLPIFNMASAIG